MSEHKSLRSAIQASAARHGDRVLQSFPHREGKVAFVENKVLDLGHVAELLAHCERCNQWANRGPLYWALSDAYHDHMNLPDGIAVTPCANGGVALEALARFHDIKHGRPVRWVGSAFSFANLGRGWFADMHLIDCDAQGMLDLEAIRRLDPAGFDGIVVTNIFGLWKDFTPYIDFARSSGKLMLIDNAAGIDQQVPDWPYQSFSLHHTKPYGAGEGGLFTSPRDEAEDIYALLDYGAIGPQNRKQWLNNGKISDIACAFQLDRLASCAEWRPLYREQAERVRKIAVAAGLTPLISVQSDIPATSHPYLAPEAVPLDQLLRGNAMVLGKYYKPLSKTAQAAAIFERLANIPTHPDVERLSDVELQRELTEILP